MRYLDPESTSRGSHSSTRAWGDDRPREPYPQRSGGRGFGGRREEPYSRDRNHDRRGRDRDDRPDAGSRAGRRSLSPARDSRPSASGGGVEGDWRVGREMKIRGRGDDDDRVRDGSKLSGFGYGRGYRKERGRPGDERAAGKGTFEAISGPGRCRTGGQGDGNPQG
jgi:hypothetical protein